MSFVVTSIVGVSEGELIAVLLADFEKLVKVTTDLDKVVLPFVVTADVGIMSVVVSADEEDALAFVVTVNDGEGIMSLVVTADVCEDVMLLLVTADVEEYTLSFVFKAGDGEGVMPVVVTLSV